MDLMNDQNIKEMEENSHFTRKENWGDIHKLSSYLILAGLIPYRNILDQAVFINNAYATSGHAKNSLHYKGLAIDCHANTSLYEQCKVASKVGLGAVGAYVHWENPGIHIDMRGLIGKPTVYWIRDDKNEIQHDNAVQKGEYWYFVDKEDWLYGVGLYEV